MKSTMLLRQVLALTAAVSSLYWAQNCFSQGPVGSPIQPIPIPVTSPAHAGISVSCPVNNSCPTTTIVGPLWDIAVTGPWILHIPDVPANNPDMNLVQHAQPQDRLNVPSPEATFTVGIAYTDDTPSPGGSGTYFSRGDYGFYQFEVDECLTNADGLKQGLYLAQDVPAGQSFATGHASQIGDCTTSSQNPGLWWIMQRKGQTLAGSNAEVNSPQLSTSTKYAQPGQTVYDTLSVAVTFLQINTVVKFQVDTWLGDSRLQGAASCYSSPCGPIQNDETQTVAPVNVVVFPTALAQLKVLPYTILYCPPGSMSTSSFSTTFTFGTTMTTGNSNELDNSTTDDNWLSEGETDDLNLGLKMGTSDSSIGINDKLAFDFMNTTRWDHSVQTGTGQTENPQFSTQWQVMTSFGNTLGAGNNANQIPGPAGPYQNEPFMSDVIVLLRRPQIALWNFQGQPVEQLLGGLGSPQGGPEWVTVAVRTLDDCANGKITYNLPPLPPGDSVLPNETLTADECLGLASLDPFYGHGQSTIVGHGPGEDQAGDRGVFVFSDTYGMGIGAQPSDEPATITDQQITGHWAQAQQMTQTSYNSTVQDIIASSATSGDTLSGTLSIYGFSVGGSDAVKSAQGETNTSNTTLKVTYQTTTAAKFEQDWTLQAKITDTHLGLVDPQTNQPYQPDVEIYQDKAFGALMFRDPGAPGSGQFKRFTTTPERCIACSLGTSP